MARRVIDMHEHLLGTNTADGMAEEYARLGVAKVVLQPMPPPSARWEEAPFRVPFREKT